MKATVSPRKGLIQPLTGKHYVHLYQNDTSLIDIVTEFIGHRLDASEAAIVIATQAHNLAILDRLEKNGIAARDLLMQGQLHIMDAEQELDRVMVEGMPDAQLFDQHIGSVMRKCLHKYKSVRAFGEMVNLLWQNGDQEAAEALEKLWNDLIKQLRLTLLCAYCMDDLDIANYQGAIDCVCSMHTDFVGSYDPEVLEKALAEASREVMSLDFSGIIESLSRIPHPTTSMTPAQASLIFLSKALPKPTQVLLEQVRAIVHQAGPADNLPLM